MSCSDHKNKGTCGVAHSIARKEVESRVIESIATKLSDPEILSVYREEYVRERKLKMAQAVGSRPALLKRQVDLKLKLGRLIQHMGSEELIPTAMTAVRQQINKVAEELQIVELELVQTPDLADMDLPGDFARRLSTQLPKLREALQADSQAASFVREILRGLIDVIILEPTPGKESHMDCPWDITITGPIQAVFNMPEVPEFPDKIARTTNSPFARRGLMVPVAGIEPATFGLQNRCSTI